MPDCSCCKRDRDKAKKPPRALERLPIEITQHKEFKRKGLPVLLCPDCDKQSYDLALETHKKRTGSGE